MRERPRAFPIPVDERIEKDKLCLSTETTWENLRFGEKKESPSYKPVAGKLHHTKAFFSFLPAEVFFTDSQY